MRKNRVLKVSLVYLCVYKVCQNQVNWLKLRILRKRKQMRRRQQGAMLLDLNIPLLLFYSRSFYFKTQSFLSKSILSISLYCQLLRLNFELFNPYSIKNQYAMDTISIFIAYRDALVPTYKSIKVCVHSYMNNSENTGKQVINLHFFCSKNLLINEWSFPYIK